MKLISNNWKYLIALIALFIGGIREGKSQLNFNYSLTGTLSEYPTLVVGSGAATLTSGNPDPFGSGWLRLTPMEQSKAGYAIIDKAFSSSQGITAEFEFKTWGTFDERATTDAKKYLGDGFSAFLYDASVSPFNIGRDGMALGYADMYSRSDDFLSGGYLGVGFDEYGDFSKGMPLKVNIFNQKEGVEFFDNYPIEKYRVRPNSIAVRGPLVQDKSWYVGGTEANLGNSSLSGTTVAYSVSTTTRPADNQYYRKARILLMPVKDVNGSTTDFIVEVQLQVDLNGPFYTVISNVLIGQSAPANLKIGFAASTGSSKAYHEIRNLKITTPVDFAITKTVSTSGRAGSSSATVNKGDAVTYTLRVANRGMNAATATITDILPNGLQLVSNPVYKPSNTSFTSITANNALTMSIYLPQGASGTISYQAKVSSNNENIKSLINTAKIEPAEGFTNVNVISNSSSATIFIKPQITNNTLSKTICSDDPVNIALSSSLSGTSYQWSRSLVRGINNDNSASETLSYPSSTITETLISNNSIPIKVNYTITPTIKVQWNGRIVTISGDPKTFIVTVINLPDLPKINGSTSFCMGGSLALSSSVTRDIASYIWTINGTQIPNSAASSTIIVTGSGTYTLAVINNNGCRSKVSINKIISVNTLPNKPTISGPSTVQVCVGGLTNLVASPADGDSYQWYKNGVLEAIQRGNTFTGASSGSYSVTISKGGCTSSSSLVKNVDENVIAVPTISGPSPVQVCVGGLTNLVASPTDGDSYQWYKNGQIQNGQTSQTFTGASSGSYSVTISKGGCTSEPSDVTVVSCTNHEITLEFSRETIYPGQKGVLKASLPTIEGIPMTAEKDIIITLATSRSKSTAKKGTHYTSLIVSQITIKKGNNWAEIELFKALDSGIKNEMTLLELKGSTQDLEYKVRPATIWIKNVKQLKPTGIVIPNVFTPDGDGYKDLWEIHGLEQYSHCRVSIYNRWGSEVFYSIGYHHPWDGTYNYKTLPVGPYFYIIDLKDGSPVLRGSVSIIR